MEFFLYDVLARIVAIYFVYDCSRKIWDASHEKKITVVNSEFFGWSNRDAHRDEAPIQYWWQISKEVSSLALSLYVAIFGLRPPW
jgi:hypothetical protein